MKYLAIDYGTKRVGLALSHEWLAVPLEVVSREKAKERILRIIADERVTTILIGIADGPMADEARTFATELRKELQSVNNSVEIVEADETLTSVETHTKLAKSSMPRNKRQQPIDHYAAAAILQNYLDVHFAHHEQ